MEILNHPACDNLLGAPSDMQEDCAALPVFETEDENGKWSVSFWKPGAEELAVLIAGGSVALWVRARGRQHPVVGLGVSEPVYPEFSGAQTE